VEEEGGGGRTLPGKGAASPPAEGDITIPFVGGGEKAAYVPHAQDALAERLPAARPSFAVCRAAQRCFTSLPRRRCWACLSCMGRLRRRLGRNGWVGGREGRRVIWAVGVPWRRRITGECWLSSSFCLLGEMALLLPYVMRLSTTSCGATMYDFSAC